MNKARQKAEREKEACDERLRSCGEFHDGLASYKNTHHYLRNETGNDKFGYIDKMGKIVIPCQWYYFRDGSPYFQLGLALVKNSSGRCGYINTKGEVVIPFKWINAWNFYKGTGTATVVDDNGKWHEINTRGEIVK